MSKSSALLNDGVHQFGLFQRQRLHVMTVFRVQDLAGQFVAKFNAVCRHFRTTSQHLAGHFKLLVHNGSRPFFTRQVQTNFPARNSHLLAHFLSELEGVFLPVFHLQHGQRRTQAQETHAMTTLTSDFLTLLL